MEMESHIGAVNGEKDKVIKLNTQLLQDKTVLEQNIVANEVILTSKEQEIKRLKVS
jgi:hypothetical protein